MAEQDEFFLADEVDGQIAEVSQHREGDRRDAEAMAYLRSYYQVDAALEQRTLDRIWQRIADATHFERTIQTNEKELPMQKPLNHAEISYGAGTMGSFRGSRSGRSSLVHRLGLLAAVVVLIALVGSMAVLFYSARYANGGTASPHSPSTVAPARGPFSVTAVTMSVTPGSIANLACGSNATVTYTAVFHVKANSGGGTVGFTYTVNNGRSATPASIHFNPGETSKAYTFTWSGALPADHTYPGLGGVQVTSPNQLTSPLVAPTGQCVSGQFQVTNITMAVSPSSIQGLSCGTSVVVTYTATISVAPNGPGGVVSFTYTVNNGRSSVPASVTFAPGETSKVYTFTWSGALPADHTYPGPGGIQVSSPNQLTSPLIAPTGQCS